MEDDDDNESVISVNRTSESNVGGRVAILKSSKSDTGSSSRRDRRRNRRYDRTLHPHFSKNKLKRSNMRIIQ